MKSEEILESLNYLKDEWIEEVDQLRKNGLKKKRRIAMTGFWSAKAGIDAKKDSASHGITKFLASAACIGLVLISVYTVGNLDKSATETADCVTDEYNGSGMYTEDSEGAMKESAAEIEESAAVTEESVEMTEDTGIGETEESVEATGDTNTTEMGEISENGEKDNSGSEYRTAYVKVLSWQQEEFVGVVIDLTERDYFDLDTKILVKLDENSYIDPNLLTGNEISNGTEVIVYFDPESVQEDIDGSSGVTQIVVHGLEVKQEGIQQE